MNLIYGIAAGILIPAGLFAQNVSFNATEACFGKTTTLAGSSTLPDSSVSSWKWDLDGDGQFDDANGKFIYHTFSSADTFKVRLKITPVSGSDDTSALKDVVVHAVPLVNFQVDNLCEGKAAVYQDQSSITKGTIAQYLWDFNNDGVVDNNSGPIVNYTCGPASSYITKLECVSDKGCKSFATKSTRVYNQPAASFTTQNNCAGDSTLFTNTSAVTNDTIAMNIWDFGDGSQGILSNGTIKHVYPSAQNYTAILIVVTNNFCRDTLSFNVAVNPLPVVSIALNGDSVIYTDQMVNLIASGASNYLWSTGAITPGITVMQSGTYTVTGTDGNGCMRSASQSVLVKEIPVIEIGTDVITPNGDNLNDYFVIEAKDAYGKCGLSVFNIWGDKIFDNPDYDNKWAGTYEGKPLDGGTYYYIITCDGQKKKTGSINILK